MPYMPTYRKIKYPEREASLSMMNQVVQEKKYGIRDLVEFIDFVGLTLYELVAANTRSLA